jgi:SAM-dependent methyltransferase
MNAPFKADASVRQRVADHIFFPLNMWLSESASHRLGLTPLDHERVRMALRFCRGRLLDVGCGNNLLVRTYGPGFGADIHRYPETDLLCEGSLLPFRSDTFDTIALLACLNHIVKKTETMRECHRVLRSGGTLLLTMIPRWVGFFSHPIRKRHDPDQTERGIGAEEDLGLSTSEVRYLLEGAGFRVLARHRFMWALNSLYIAGK